jgi:hypothetical protein
MSQPFEVPQHPRSGHLAAVLEAPARKPLGDSLADLAKSYYKGEALAGGEMLSRFWSYSVNVVAKLDPFSAEFLNPVTGAVGAGVTRVLGGKPDPFEKLNAVMSDLVLARSSQSR